ncbi:MAG TPA: ABC transporter ATP-binding protein [Acidimicrobiales bacterium]|nr:ABC transporter ATP-binding protein [Acidimicrobiales bacterium]
MAASIQLQGVGKRFIKYEDTPLLVTSAKRLRAQNRREMLWAVRGVDFEVHEGECFGIIGRNGSGKTTLMSMMAGVTSPTEGSVKVWGRIAPLISVGVGFHPELTGRENVYLNGTILGLTKAEIDQRLESIIDFAEIEEFIDTPVKFYSSGMFVRLGFSVAIHAEPDVLLVDEVLAVGDLAFQVKCFDRMEQIRHSGTTVAVVSHNITVVRKMCDRVLVMHAGQPRYIGPTSEAIALFHQIMSEESKSFVNPDRNMLFEHDVVEVLEASLVDAEGLPAGHVEAGSPVAIKVVARALAAIDDVVVGFTILGTDGTRVYSDFTVPTGLGPMAAGQETTFTASFRATLADGSYTVLVALRRPDLKTQLADGGPFTFFVNGRRAVAGLADLEARFDRIDGASAEAAVAAPSRSRAEGGQEPKL